MSDVAARFRAFLVDAPHWVDLLAAEPARHLLRHDTTHPAFHGCIDWHSACHGAWALLAHQRLTGQAVHSAIIDTVLMPQKIADEMRDLAARPDFEMPYGRAWFLRLALEDRLVTGSTRLTPAGKEMASSLVEFYSSKPPSMFAREYANPSWALLNLLDYARVEGREDLTAFVRETAARMAPQIDQLPPEMEENGWTDFMAVTANFCALMIRVEAISPRVIVEKAGKRLLALKPVTDPQRAHHHALNFSRAWALMDMFRATSDERFLNSYLDHVETNLRRPSWWRGDYRGVAHWVPQFGIFALQRALLEGEPT
jgi:hypothetical protein